jgi:thiaminase
MTTHLLSTSPHPTSLRLATQPPFLRAAGLGQIPKPLLSAYLSQDRLYQHAYVRLVGQLLSKIRFDSPASSDRLARKITNTLIDALVGIRNELDFFEAVAAKYGFALASGGAAAGPTPMTRAYTDFFASVSSPGSSLLEGLVALWATEKCYLEAWRWAKSFAPATEDSSTGNSASYAQDADGGATRQELMPSWTSEAFAEVVAGIAGLVDEVVEAERERMGAGEWEVVERRCEEVWRQVLWLEERFWPVLEGEGMER